MSVFGTVGDYTQASSALERAPTYMTGPPVVEEEEKKRLQKKFRGRSVADILESVKRDTYYDQQEQTVRQRVFYLLVNPPDRRGPEGFRGAAEEIGQVLARTPAVQEAFTNSLLWDL